MHKSPCVVGGAARGTPGCDPGPKASEGNSGTEHPIRQTRGASFPRIAREAAGSQCVHRGRIAPRRAPISLYKCGGCQKQVQMTYEAKVELPADRLDRPKNYVRIAPGKSGRQSSARYDDLLKPAALGDRALAAPGGTRLCARSGYGRTGGRARDGNSYGDLGIGKSPIGSVRLIHIRANRSMSARRSGSFMLSARDKHSHALAR